MRYVVYSNFSKMSPETKSVLKMLGRNLLPAGLAMLGGYHGMAYGEDTDNLEHIGSLLTGRPESGKFSDYIIDQTPDLINTGASPVAVREMLENMRAAGEYVDRNRYNDLIYKYAPDIAKTGSYYGDALLDPDEAEYNKRLNKLFIPLSWSSVPVHGVTAPEDVKVDINAYDSWNQNLDEKLRLSQEMHDNIVKYHLPYQYGLAGSGFLAGAGSGLLLNQGIEKAWKKYGPRKTGEISTYPTQGYAYSFSNPIRSGIGALALSVALMLSPQAKAQAASGNMNSVPEEISQVAERLPASQRDSFIKEVCYAVRYFGGERQKVVDSNNLTLPREKRAVSDSGYSVIDATVGNPECLDSVKAARVALPVRDDAYNKAVRSVADRYVSDIEDLFNSSLVTIPSVDEFRKDQSKEYQISENIRKKLIPNAEIVSMKNGINGQAPAWYGYQRWGLFNGNHLEGKFRLPIKLDKNNYGPDASEKRGSVSTLVHEKSHDLDEVSGSASFGDEYGGNGKGIDLVEYLATNTQRKILDNLTLPESLRDYHAAHSHLYGATDVIKENFKDHPERFTDPKYLAEFIDQLKKSRDQGDEYAKNILTQLENIDPSIIKPEARRLGENADSRSRGLSAVRDVLKRNREKLEKKYGTVPAGKPAEAESQNNSAGDAGNKK